MPHRCFPRANRSLLLLRQLIQAGHRARSVVVRHVDSDGSLWFTCDFRSEKAAHIAARNDAEMVLGSPFRESNFAFSVR